MLDHIIPLALGGPHHDLNLIPACRPCNETKGARVRLPGVWRSEIQETFVAAMLTGLVLDTRPSLGGVVTR